jgi:O-antigen/teichoic acid export membrane protein
MNAVDPRTAEPQSESLGRTSTRGVLWNGATFATSKLLVLATTVVLARLLTPDDFGLVGIGLLVIGFLDLFNDFGVSAAVVQNRDAPERTANVAFWVNMALGSVLTLVGVTAAPLVADFFDEPRATAVVQVLSLSLLLSSLGAIHEARLRRDLRFRRRLAPELGRAIAKGATAITLALLGAGVWSLVWGQLAGEFTASVLYWFALRWRPLFVVDLAVTRRLIGFGSKIALVGLLGGILRNADYLVVGRALGTRALGLYTLAFRLPQLLIEGAVTIVGQVAFPAFARVQHDPVRLRSGLLRAQRLTALVITPLGLGLAVTADPFVRAVYGEQWVPAIQVMQLLAVYMVVQGASRLVGDVYKATGRAGLLSKLAVLKLVITLPLLVVFVQGGIRDVALAQVISATICTIIDLAVVRRVVDVTWADLAATFLPAARAGAVLVMGCVLVARALSGAGAWVELAVVSATGVGCYLGALAAFDKGALTEVRGLLRGRRPRHGLSESRRRPTDMATSGDG